MAKGIDISKHQGSIDFAKVKSAGIEFAILRAGYGQAKSQVDPYFYTYADACLKNGIDVGVYWFSYAVSVETAKQEAQLCLKTIEKYKGKFTYPVYFDYEYDSEVYSKNQGVVPTLELRTNMALAFCQEIEKGGWRAGVYTNLDYIRNRININKLSAYELWLADYTNGPDYSCGMQQTGSSGRISGISGNVDTDTAFIDYPAVLAQKGYNGLKADIQPTKGWTSDTTNDASNPVLIAQDKIYTVKITGEDIGLVCGTSAGKPAAFKLIRCRRENNYTLWHVVPVGEVGQEAGIYPAGGGDRIFVARITK